MTHRIGDVVSIDTRAAEVLSSTRPMGSAGPPSPPRPPPGAEDSTEATAPGLARPQSPRALSLLDDEVTVAHDLEAAANRRERAMRPRLPPVFDADPATLPVGHRLPAVLGDDDETLSEREEFGGDGVTALKIESPAPEAPPAPIVPVVPVGPVAPSSLDDSMAELRPRDPAPIYRVAGLHDDAPAAPRPRPRTLAPPIAAPAPPPATASPASPPAPRSAPTFTPAPQVPGFVPAPPRSPSPSPAPQVRLPTPAVAPAAAQVHAPPAATLPVAAPPPEPPAPDLFDVLPPEAPTPAAPPPRAPAVPARAFAEPDEESVERPLARTPLARPCMLRAAISWRKANPGGAEPEEIAVALTRCIAALHERGVVLGERVVPENFNCLTDGSVEYLEALDPPPRPIVEQYLAPELFRGREATAQTDVFGAAAVVYELLVARALKPAFLPQVLQSTRTDTWFSDPGPTFPEPYRVLLRSALSDRPAQRHPDMASFSEELFRAFRIVHSPARRMAAKEAPKPFWTRGVKIGVGVAVFVLFLLVLAFFPIDQLTAPPVPTVQPSLGQ